MHNTVDYSKIEHEGKKRSAAINDIKEYFGEERWAALMEVVEDPNTTCQTLDFLLNFAGVQGFPVHAFMKRYRATDYQAWYDSLPEGK